ncbi:MAG TPA: hypothetical protein VHR42_08580 [Clostridia bacterium]|nr:hypothetical protein [Clostridia bacterium]
MSNQEIKTVVERYCPVIGKNVAVEISRTGQSKPSCLNSHDCETSGGCKNKLFTGR